MSNIGVNERIARAVVGFALLYWAMTPFGPTLPAGYAGLFVLATAIVGWCPWYKSFRTKAVQGQ